MYLGAETLKRAAGLLILRSDGCIFLALRASWLRDPLMWSIPGGAVEPGEDEWQAAIRETKEELGSLPPVRCIDVVRYRHGDMRYTAFVVGMSRAAAAKWKVRLNPENLDWAWFDPDDLPQPLHPGVARVLTRV